MRRPSHTLQQTRQRVLGGTLIVTLGVTVVAWAPPALADPGDAEAIAAIAAAAVQAEGKELPIYITPEPIDPVVTEDGEVTFEHETVPVTVQAPTHQGTNVTIGSQTVRLSGPNAGTSPVSVDFQTFVTDASGPTDSVIKKNNRQVREMVVINSATAPSEYTFTLTGAEFVMQDGGSVVIHDPNGEPIGGVEPAWARDANGNSLPTYYTVGLSGQLVQHVDYSGAAFPVVIDPTITFGWYVYIRYSKYETHSIWAKIAYYGWSMTAALCAYLPVTWVRAACIAGVSAYSLWWRDKLKEAHDNWKCLEVRMTYNGWVVGLRTYYC